MIFLELLLVLEILTLQPQFSNNLTALACSSILDNLAMLNGFFSRRWLFYKCIFTCLINRMYIIKAYI